MNLEQKGVEILLPLNSAQGLVRRLLLALAGSLSLPVARALPSRPEDARGSGAACRARPGLLLTVGRRRRAGRRLSSLTHAPCSSCCSVSLSRLLFLKRLYVSGRRLDGRLGPLVTTPAGVRRPPVSPAPLHPEAPLPPSAPPAPAPPAGPPQQRPRLDLAAEGQFGGGGSQGTERAGAQAVEHAPEAAPHCARLEVRGESGGGVGVDSRAHPSAGELRLSIHGARHHLSVRPPRQPPPGPRALRDWTAASRDERLTVRLSVIALGKSLSELLVNFQRLKDNAKLWKDSKQESERIRMILQATVRRSLAEAELMSKSIPEKSTKDYRKSGTLITINESHQLVCTQFHESVEPQGWGGRQAEGLRVVVTVDVRQTAPKHWGTQLRLLGGTSWLGGVAVCKLNLVTFFEQRALGCEEKETTVIHSGWHFTVLLPVGMVGTGEVVVLMPLNTYSQDTDVIPRHNIDEKTTQSRRKKRRKWQLLSLQESYY
eukprot:bmy_18083T0